MPWPAYDTLLCGTMRVLKAVGKFSENVRVFTANLVCELHWLSEVALLADAVKPPWTKQTVGVALEIESDVAPLVEIEAMHGVPPAAEPPLNALALTRALVMRIVRVLPTVTGARNGIPKNVMVLPLTRPWNTFGGAVVLTLVQAPAALNVVQVP